MILVVQQTMVRAQTMLQVQMQTDGGIDGPHARSSARWRTVLTSASVTCVGQLSVL